MVAEDSASEPQHVAEALSWIHSFLFGEGPPSTSDPREQWRILGRFIVSRVGAQRRQREMEPERRAGTDGRADGKAPLGEASMSFTLPTHRPLLAAVELYPFLKDPPPEKLAAPARVIAPVLAHFKGVFQRQVLPMDPKLEVMHHCDDGGSSSEENSSGEGGGGSSSSSSSDGYRVYVDFPELSTVEAQQVFQSPSSSSSSSSSSSPSPSSSSASFLEEKPWQFSKRPWPEIRVAILLGVTNLLGVLWLQWLLFMPQSASLPVSLFDRIFTSASVATNTAPSSSLSSSSSSSSPLELSSSLEASSSSQYHSLPGLLYGAFVASLRWFLSSFLMVYALAYFALPGLRYLWILAINGKIADRNSRRRHMAERLEQQQQR